MNRVSALAQQYDAAVGTGQENAKVNVNDLVDIIKSASTARQTGTLIGNKTPPIVGHEPHCELRPGGSAGGRRGKP